MEQTVLQRKVNYIAPKIKTETDAENSYRQIRVAAYCRVWKNSSTAMKFR